MSAGIEHDIAVVGLGVLGSMVIREAAQRGRDVVGIEAHQPGHDLGASGGHTRIFRVAYKEGAAYVPLLLESLRLWQEIQAGSGLQILEQFGALTIGPARHPDIAAVREVALATDLDIEVLDARETALRWPQHLLDPGDVTIVDPLGALLRPANAIRAAVEQAGELRARVLTGTRVDRVTAVGRGYALHTEHGETIRARRVVYALGPWTQDLVPALATRVELRRVVLSWRRALQSDRFPYTPQAFPVGIRRGAEGRNFSFFPAVDELGMKLNFHVERQVLATMAGASHPPEDQPSYDREAAEAFRGLEEAPNRIGYYVDGYTADLRPVLGRLDDEATWVVAGGSGQSFKMAPALARVLLDSIEDGRSPSPHLPVIPPVEESVP